MCVEFVKIAGAAGTITVLKAPLTDLLIKVRQQLGECLTTPALMDHKGSFQQYITTSARYATRIPDGVSDDLAAPLMCAGITAYRSLMESNYKQGNWVVFPGGGGGVGIMAVQIAKVLGLRPIVIDAGTDKESAALENGAEIFLDFEKVADIPSQVVSICGGIGAHGVVVTAAQAYSNAVSYVGRRTGAKIMCIGMRKYFMTTFGILLTKVQQKPRCLSAVRSIRLSCKT